MTKLVLSLILFAVVLVGQTAAPAAPAAPTPQPVINAPNFYGMGVSLLPQSSPKPTGWAVLAVEANAKQSIWSFSELDFNLVKNQVQTAALTGIGTPLRTIGNVTIFAIGAGGASTVGSTSGGAISGGAIVHIPLKGGVDGAILFGYEALKTSNGGTQQIVKFGWGSK